MLDALLESHLPYSQRQESPLQWIYLEEMKLALTWLFQIRQTQDDLVGWGWIQHIPANEQNTAEVVHALLLSFESFSDSEIEILYQSIQSFLLEPEQHGRITMDYTWILIALQIVEQRLPLFEKVCNIPLFKQQIQKAKAQCTRWILSQQNSDGGWGDTKGSISLVSRTALAVMALRQGDSVITALNWLQKQQNDDGGFGNLNPTSPDSMSVHEQLRHFTTLDKLKYQHQSNLACTALAMMAMQYAPNSLHSSVQKAFNWLIDNQQSNGSWQVFQEVGIRDDKVFTFRYFSTAWALQALVGSGLCDYDELRVLNGVDYLLTLQDEYTSGWRTSLDTDPFTWATCNAIVALHYLRRNASKLKSQNWVGILREWKELKRQREVYTVKVFGKYYSSNMSMTILFSTVFTILCLLSIWVVNHNLVLTKWALYILTAVISAIMGIPWIAATRFSNRDLNWLQSFSLVYGPIGIILGVLLVLV